MSIPNIIFDATAKNTEIILTTPTVARAQFGLDAQIIFTGAGRDQWFQINQDNDNVNVQVCCDGSLIGSQMPSGNLLTGSFTFNPSSPTIAKLYNITNAQTNGIGGIIPCILTIVNVNTKVTTQYQNFVLTKTFTGYTYNNQVDDYTFTFKCTVPQYVDLSSLTNIAGLL